MMITFVDYKNLNLLVLYYYIDMNIISMSESIRNEYSIKSLGLSAQPNSYVLYQFAAIFLHAQPEVIRI